MSFEIEFGWINEDDTCKCSGRLNRQHKTTKKTEF